MTLRRATLGDAEAIYGMIQRHRGELVPRSMGNIVENIDRFLVAECGGEMAGCTAYQIWPELGSPLKATVEIQSVVVEEGWRRRGAGRMLVDGVVERVRPFRPAEILALTLTPEFFASMGFAEVPKTRIMHKLYAGCINCTKHTDPFTCPEKAVALKLK